MKNACKHLSPGLRLARLLLVGVAALGLARGVGAEGEGDRAVASVLERERAPMIVLLESPKLPRHSRAQGLRRRAVARQVDSLLESAPAARLKVLKRFELVPALVVTGAEEDLDELSRDPRVRRVEPAARGGGALADSVPQIRADRVQARGVEGEGTVIAVLDTGIDPGHPDLDDALLHEECFCLGNCCPDGTNRQSGPGSATSRHRHGPNVTGIALSRGIVSSVGVAPRSSLVAVRVLDDRNRGFLVDWIEGLDWIAANRPDVRVVNMSLASDRIYAGECGGSCTEDPLCAENMLFADLIDLLRNRGTLVFAAAGNNGRSEALSSPACVPEAVAVGAVTSNDEVAALSNAGPLLDLLAPGISIVSDGIDGGVSVMSGTSMATPHASGTAALLLSARPGASAAEVENLLETTGVPVFDDRSGRSTPRVDALAALNAAIEDRELQPGGGSSRSDCLLEWNVLPATVVRRGRRPTVACVDGDPFCDFDLTEGQCTLSLALCFNVPDPLLHRCEVGAPLLSYQLLSPSLDAPPGSIERRNAETIAGSLPTFPLSGTSVCSPSFPVVVPRRNGGDGRIDVRMAVESTTLRDYDRLSLLCTVP